jgi:hypothetical protein
VSIVPQETLSLHPDNPPALLVLLVDFPMKQNHSPVIRATPELLSHRQDKRRVRNVRSDYLRRVADYRHAHYANQEPIPLIMVLSTVQNVLPDTISQDLVPLNVSHVLQGPSLPVLGLLSVSLAQSEPFKIKRHRLSVRIVKQDRMRD